MATATNISHDEFLNTHPEIKFLFDELSPQAKELFEEIYYLPKELQANLLADMKISRQLNQSQFWSIENGSSCS